VPASASFEVLVGEEVHVTLLRALRYLGLGHDRVKRVGVDANGAMDPRALEDALSSTAAPVRGEPVRRGDSRSLGW
jgi:glutamate/tyrosine decarboxylase-like PLP-dependent enzyme